MGAGQLQVDLPWTLLPPSCWGQRGHTGAECAGELRRGELRLGEMGDVACVLPLSEMPAGREDEAET